MKLSSYWNPRHSSKAFSSEEKEKKKNPLDTNVLNWVDKKKKKKGVKKGSLNIPMHHQQGKK